MNVKMTRAHLFLYHQFFNLIIYHLRVNEQKDDNVCEEVKLINHVYEIQKHLKDIRIQRFREIIRDHEINRYVFYLNSTFFNCLTNSMSFVNNMFRALMMFKIF